MPTTPRIDPTRSKAVVLGPQAPRLDPNSDAAGHLLFRLKHNNQALDELRRALENDEQNTAGEALAD